ncbi:MAG: thioredoxin fold domain-containing protein [Gammaproteobacteria bacterium]|nr:thioredoxin fold domain-containing protein [Gammaproteobacteria bacterium]
MFRLFKKIKSHALNLLLISFLFSGISAYAVEKATPENNSVLTDMVNPGYHEKPAWFKESFLDLREDVQEATANQKRVLLYFYQDGCPYCAKLLQDNLGQKNIADKTRNNFDVIAINMWGDKEVTDLTGQLTTEKKFSEKMKVMYTPTLVFLTEQGKVALRVNGYYAPNKFETALDYVRGKNESKITFRDYIRKFIKKSSSGKLHTQSFILKPPYNLQKLISFPKPLIVLFEQKKCYSCDELHNDIFRRKETIEQINRFNIVRLDMWSNEKLVDIQGKTISAKTLAKTFKINHSPSFIFFDNKGSEVFRIDAYLKSFHTQSVMDYVASGAYKTQSNFQRFIGERADKLEAQGIHVDLMN